MPDHKIEIAGGQFSHRMLNLDAGIHLHEVEVTILIEQEFERAGACVPGRLGALDRRSQQVLTHFARQVGRRRFFHQFLVPALK
ncbi:MAG: hypothetical protein R2843_15230 [Thermomicrobiales bacterium]